MCQKYVVKVTHVKNCVVYFLLNFGLKMIDPLILEAV